MLETTMSPEPDAASAETPEGVGGSSSTPVESTADEALATDPPENSGGGGS